MLAVRLPESIEKRLEDLAQRTGRTKTFYVREAILQHLEEIEDIYLAEGTLDRIRSGKEQTIPLKDAMKRPMENAGRMNLQELLITAPNVIQEMATEFFRRGDECMKADETSQLTACFLLALRSASLLCGMGLLMKPNTRDSWDVLARSLMESRDLLMNFRSDDQGTRNKIKTWFAGQNNNAWKAEHKKCERFWANLGGGELELGKRWSMFSALSHPTVHAARRSSAMAVSWVTGRTKVEDFEETMRPKIVDYITSLRTLIVVATFDLPGWISLGCDLSRMPHVEPFETNAARVTSPLLAQTKDNTLPKDSYRSE